MARHEPGDAVGDGVFGEEAQQARDADAGSEVAGGVVGEVVGGVGAWRQGVSRQGNLRRGRLEDASRTGAQPAGDGVEVDGEDDADFGRGGGSCGGLHGAGRIQEAGPTLETGEKRREDCLTRQRAGWVVAL